MTNLVKIKRGNSVSIEILCLDRNDDIITDLASTGDIDFQVKKRKKQTSPDIRARKAFILPPIPGLSQIAWDTPLLGWVTVILEAADTEVDVGIYFMALELIWNPPLQIYESRILVEGVETDRMEIVQNIIQ